jgi:hypothetical protein
MKTRPSRFASLGIALVLCATAAPTLLIGRAHAIIGRPLTPFSYAGVARRTTRRAVYAGAAVGAYGGYGYAAPVAAPVAVPVPTPVPAPYPYPYPAPAAVW